METFPVYRKDGHTIGFEIENVYVSGTTIARLLKRTDGVTDVRVTGHFGSADDARVVFKYRGHDFMVFEPYGDSSRYAIGPMKPDEDVIDITELENAFKLYRPPLHRGLLGDILTLRPFKRRRKS